jgi:ABC-type transport system involved in multi-copper enzyme maturation permease subunit
VSTATAIRIVAGHALRESLRRRVFAVVSGLSLAFGGLYAFGCSELFKDVNDFGDPSSGLDSTTLAGSTILGLAMFGTLFLGVVLAVFLTLGAVRGDAERGLLQPLVVRPLGRGTYLVARWLAAATVSAIYVAIVFVGAVVITGLIGDWWPDHVLLPTLELAGAVAIVAAVSLLGSVFLSTTANGIAVLMVFGTGLLAGLLGEIGDALNAHSLTRIADTAAWILPFEALYRDALHQLIADAGGITGAIIQLGPLGGSHSGGSWLAPWSAAYVMLVGVAAITAFARRDL